MPTIFEQFKQIESQFQQLQLLLKYYLNYSE